MDDTQYQYEVINVNLAAIYLCLNKRIIETRPRSDRPEFLVFIFEMDPEMLEIKKAFDRRELKVEPQRFIENLRYLKNLAVEERN